MSNILLRIIMIEDFKKKHYKWNKSRYNKMCTMNFNMNFYGYIE